MSADVRFPDGTRVQAAGLLDGRAPDDRPDRGLYLDPRWEPDWPATLVRWPDHGTPESDRDAAAAIVDAFDRARAGQRIEIGCYAGIGRTGTVLACMAALAGVPSEDAVGWVRRHYHPYAVETAEQRAWVEWFAQRREDPASTA